MKKVLIVNPFGIGDVLFTRPLVAALRFSFPEVSISYVGNHRTRSLLESDPRLERVFSYERDEFVAAYRRSWIEFLGKWLELVRELRDGQFDTAFDCSLGSPLALALVLAGIPRRIGYDYKGRGRWLTEKVPLKGYEGQAVAQYWLDLFRVSAGTGAAGVPDVFPDLEIPAADNHWRADFCRDHGLVPGKYIVIHPGGGASWGKNAGFKRWPPGNFAKLADKMIEKGGCPIILVGDAGEVGLCRQVAGEMQYPSLVLAGTLGLMQSAALMKEARLVIVNDGGLLHLAAAAGASTVSIFGPVDPVVYGPFPREKHVVIQMGLGCQPCYRNFRMSDCVHQACLKKLEVEDVFNKIMEMI